MGNMDFVATSQYVSGWDLAKKQIHAVAYWPDGVCAAFGDRHHLAGVSHLGFHHACSRYAYLRRIVVVRSANLMDTLVRSAARIVVD